MLEIANHKSSLAKLMAEENILVEQKAVPTAYFDTAKRVLTLPLLKEDLSVDVTDLLISHEIGHALYTPHDKWVDYLSKIRTSIINMVEDARIEKLIKRKYPGLRPLYYRAYKELNQKDFFGLSKMDLCSLNLADKINIYFKVGLHTEIKFNEEEKDLVKKVSECETFDDVYNVSLEIQEYMKSQLENFEQEETLIEETLIEETFENSNEFDTQPEPNPDLDSKTQIISENNFSDLISDENKKSYYVDIPKIDMNEIIIDYKILYQRFYSSLFYDPRKAEGFYAEFITESYPSIQFLVKEFLLRKKAEGRKKVKLARTGDICTNKMYRYKTSDDIFRKNAIVSNVQSHGLVFFLDWSRSMQTIINDTVKQLIELLLFCKKVNIPYEVYSFTDKYLGSYGPMYSRPRKHSSDEISIIQNFNLLNIFSSRMGNNEFIKAAETLIHITSDKFVARPPWFNMGNTPLNNTIILSDFILDDFKQRTKVDIVNAIYLTDGASTPLITDIRGDDYIPYILSDEKRNVYLRNRKTNNIKLMKRNNKMFTDLKQIHETEACVDFIKQNSNYRMFGFRLISQRAFYSTFQDLYGDHLEACKARKTFLKEGCFNFEKSNFDAFYFIKECKKDSSTVVINPDKSVKVIATAFEKNLNSSLSNKIFLKKFIEFIA